MRTVTVIIALLLDACCDEELPKCADLGCPNHPSGTDGIWSVCEPEAEVCWCWGTGHSLACTRDDD